MAKYQKTFTAAVAAVWRAGGDAAIVHLILISLSINQVGKTSVMYGRKKKSANIRPVGCGALSLSLSLSLSFHQNISSFLLKIIIKIVKEK